jgi:putative N-acetyltransferase (TIGR04045 family)
MAVAASRSRSLRPSELRTRPEIHCRLVASESERELHYAIRHAAFVEEQRIFPVDDRDERDADALHIVGVVDGVVAGAVRIYRLDDTGLWKGDRLAVLEPFRQHGLGAPLVRFAVKTAGERGGHTMVAQIQPQHVAFFERLGWRRVGPVADYVGLPHQKMEIALSAERPLSPAP